MVETRELDKLTIITFLATLYHKFSEKVPRPAPRIFLNMEDENNYKSSNIQEMKPRVKWFLLTDYYYQPIKNKRGNPKNIATMRCDHIQVVSYHKYNQLQGKGKKSRQSRCLILSGKIKYFRLNLQMVFHS